ncbi:hypothetical protein PLICRDRAFT_87440 [Plicaturopsis crispa FD-325 SS-3]|nr:hypothetical protein PLICRDRAFT_87440 [Plicaturopsis crispa FD-325 SS-3]
MLHWSKQKTHSHFLSLARTRRLLSTVRYPIMTSLISRSHGPPLVGIFMSLILYGAMITQCVFYWQNYRRDPAWIRIYVCFLLFVDTLSTVLAVTWIYGLLINDFGDLSKFTKSSWLLASDPALAGLTGTFCQLFYAYRAKYLTNRVWVGIAIAVLSIICGLCAIGVGIAVGIVAEMSRFRDFDAIGSVWLVLTSVVDIVITGIVSYNLRRSRSDFKRTKDVLSRIVLVTVSTCAMTSACALTELAFFLWMPGTGFHIAFSFVIPKLYCNSVLSSLNAREINGALNPGELPSIDDNYVGGQGESMQFTPPPYHTNTGDIVIHVSEETHTSSSETHTHTSSETHAHTSREVSRKDADAEWEDGRRC